MIPVENFEEKKREIAGRTWFPVEVARVNDQVVRMAFVKGEYHWHRHENEDELFYVLEGSMAVQMKDHPDITLQEGEMAVIPKGVEHCPKSTGETYILMFEPASLRSKGD